MKNLIFDLGGVIITLDQQQAIRRFEEIGLKDASRMLDAYTQQGIFGDLECGRISELQFREALGQLVGRTLTFQECQYAWRGYCHEVPQQNLDVLLRLKADGYRLILLSNTNPYMMDWAESSHFDGHGHGLGYYFDAMYKSYQIGYMKPDARFFQYVMSHEHIVPQESLFIDDGERNIEAGKQLGLHTYLAANGEDWAGKIYSLLL